MPRPSIHGRAGAIAAQARGRGGAGRRRRARRARLAAPRLRGWQRIEAPYDRARARELIGLACRALATKTARSLESAAARSIFGRLGAAPDLARIASAAGCRPARHPLTPRELQVLRLVAAGKTNATIAAELFLSERTIERHLSNIFTKLDLSTRTAATAWAYEHGLI